MVYLNKCMSNRKLYRQAVNTIFPHETVQAQADLGLQKPDRFISSLFVLSLAYTADAIQIETLHHLLIGGTVVECAGMIGCKLFPHKIHELIFSLKRLHFCPGNVCANSSNHFSCFSCAHPAAVEECRSSLQFQYGTQAKMDSFL